MYQNPALSALTSSVPPLSLSSSSSSSSSSSPSFLPLHLLSSFSQGKTGSSLLLDSDVFHEVAPLLAFVKAISQWRGRSSIDVMAFSPGKGTKELTRLTSCQLGLLGFRTKVESLIKEFSNKLPKNKTSPPSPSNVLVPLHQPITGSNQSSRTSGGKSRTGGGMINSFTTPPTQITSVSHNVSCTHSLFTISNLFAITIHANFTSYYIGNSITSTTGLGVASPNTIASSVNTSGTTRSTPLRPVRMSPASKKFTTPPKKGEGDLPPPMSIEETIKSLEHLGIYPQIELWFDHLRQWFSA